MEQSDEQNPPPAEFESSPESATASAADGLEKSVREACLGDVVNAGFVAITEGFLYRKIGLCFDYFSPAGSFPRKTIPTAKEARQGLPNATGAGTGIAESARNGGILFDTYLTRLESGFAGANDERVFDRLIGGLIRTATVAPQGFLVRGLTPDGRGFYPVTDIDAHLFWAHSAWRGYHTPVIAYESQQKIRNIVGKWINRLEKSKFTLLTVDGNAQENGDLQAIDWQNGPKFLALLAVAADLTKDVRLWELYREKVAENDSARLRCQIPQDLTHPHELQSVQFALRLLTDLDEDENRRALFQTARHEVALSAVPFLLRYQETKDSIFEETPDLNWRKISPDDDSATTDDEFVMPAAWRRLGHEKETVQASLEAAMILLLTEDLSLLSDFAGAIQECLTRVPWKKLWLASSLTAGLNTYVRGVDLGLWEEDELAVRQDLSATIPRIEKYLQEEYDEEHPSEAGHLTAPKRQIKELIGQEKEGRGRKRGRGRSRSRDRNRRGRGRGRNSTK